MNERNPEDLKMTEKHLHNFIKTLKDFGDITTEGICYYTYEELKAEAVKHYKSLLLEIDNPKEDCPEVTWNYSIAFIRNWIKHFFNLTEEDLK